MTPTKEANHADNPPPMWPFDERARAIHKQATHPGALGRTPDDGGLAVDRHLPHPVAADSVLLLAIKEILDASISRHGPPKSLYVGSKEYRALHSVARQTIAAGHDFFTLSPDDQMTLNDVPVIRVMAERHMRAF